MTASLKPYIITPDLAPRMADWINTRNGIAIWQSIDLSRPGQTASTPVNTSTGEPATKPFWWVDDQPACIITDFADVLVSKDVEVRRFRVAVRASGTGASLKCTDASTRKIRAAVERAGEGSYYQFDYGTQEAVIYKPESQVPLLDYLASAAPEA